MASIVRAAAHGPAAAVSSAEQSRLRSASVLKPLLFWAAARSAEFAGKPGEWRALAEPAVVFSGNDPTVEVWNRCSGHWLLDEIRHMTGIWWPVEPGGARSFGRVLIRADEVATAYLRLSTEAAAGDEHARLLLGYMRAVPSEMDFGARESAAAALAVPREQVAVKTGWFCDTDETALRTHAVTVTDTDHGPVVSAVLTTVEVDDATRSAYTRAYTGGREVLSVHQSHAGDLIAEATQQVLTAATQRS